jgi:hypothetical protein
MEFQGPEPADLANVIALNGAFLDWLRVTGRTQPLEPGLPPDVEAALAGLDRRQLERLARVPFLLMSLREYDDTRWRSLFADRRSMDLLRPLQPVDEEATRLVTAGLGFLWQLALRNPYAARLVSGASLNWCEQLADCTLMELFARVAEEGPLLDPRMTDCPELWHKRLTAGVSTRRDVRIAARVSALQTILTRGPATAYRQLATAACAMPAASLRVAQRRRR